VVRQVVGIGFRRASADPSWGWLGPGGVLAWYQHQGLVVVH